MDYFCCLIPRIVGIFIGGRTESRINCQMVLHSVLLLLLLLFLWPSLSKGIWVDDHLRTHRRGEHDNAGRRVHDSRVIPSVAFVVAVEPDPEFHSVPSTLYDFNNLEQGNNGCQVVPEEHWMGYVQVVQRCVVVGGPSVCIWGGYRERITLVKKKKGGHDLKLYRYMGT